MYWLKPSPVPRRAAAVLLVIVAFVWDLRGSDTVAYPFTAAAIERGESVAGSITWRDVPSGLLPEPATSGYAVIDLPPGMPIVESAVAGKVVAPPGWWSVPVEGAGHAAVGDTVLLVAADPPFEVEGLVTDGQRGDRFGAGFRPALVAVPGSHAASVAAAAARGALLVAVRPNEVANTPGE